MAESIAHTQNPATTRVLAAGAIGGAAGGVGMGLFIMTQSAATSNGFLTPLEVCMASFVYRAEARMMEHDMMMHPGMSMAVPLNSGHVAVGALLHLGFSVVVGVAFAVVLFQLARTRLTFLRSYGGYVAGAVAGAAILYLGMMYLVLPWANSLMCNQTPRGPFFLGHVIFGFVFGLVALPLTRRWVDQPWGA